MVGMAERCKYSKFIYYRVFDLTLENAFCSNLGIEKTQIFLFAQTKVVFAGSFLVF